MKYTQKWIIRQSIKLGSVVGVVIALVSGCYYMPPDDGMATTPSPTPEPGPPTPTPTPLVPTEGDYTLSGTLAYQYVPYDDRGGGLDYSATYDRPIRGVHLYLMDAVDDSAIDNMVVGDDGAFAFSWHGSNFVKLWVYAQTDTPTIYVEDNTSDDALWVMESDLVNALETSTFDYVAKTGWTGATYQGERASAPFAVLDAAYTAASRFLNETDPPPDFPALHINWSPKNRPEDGEKSAGQIGTSHWDSKELYILGMADVDTDEFDSHVIVHEWGHYFESKISRADSIGGNHMTGDVLDPRVALSEGWGNALSAMILDPDSVYTDSYGKGQQSGFEFDLEDNITLTSHNPGWYSEESIQAILYDLYDAANESQDSIELGLDPIYRVLTGDYKQTEAYTTLFSFITYLKAMYPQYADAVDELVTYHTANSSYGVDAVQDEWGTGETHDGGVASALPLYIQASIGDTVELEFQGGYDPNKLAQNRYVIFTGDGEIIKLKTESDQDVDLFVQYQGDYLDWAQTTSGYETADFRSQDGAVYVVNVQGWASTYGTYTATLKIYE